MREYNWALATDDDIDDVIEMTTDHIQRSTYTNPINYFKVEATIIELMTTDTGLVLLVKDGDTNVGLLLAKAHELMFSDDKVASEIVLYTRPGHPRVLPMLKTAYEYWAEHKMGAFGATLSNAPNEYADRLSRVYQRWGYAPVESSFLKRF